MPPHEREVRPSVSVDGERGRAEVVRVVTRLAHQAELLRVRIRVTRRARHRDSALDDVAVARRAPRHGVLAGQREAGALMRELRRGPRVRAVTSLARTLAVAALFELGASFGRRRARVEVVERALVLVDVTTRAIIRQRLIASDLVAL